jgi:hypothetical protein
LSRENAQACLEAEATKLKVAKMYSESSRHVKAVVAALELRAVSKIWIKGWPKGVARVSSGLPKQYRMKM